MKTALLSLPLIITFLAPQMRADLADLENAKLKRGIVLVAGKISANTEKQVVSLAKDTKLTIYFQSADASQVLAMRQAANEAGLLGKRIFVEQSRLERICLGDNMVDLAVARGVKEKELLRVLRPGAEATLADRKIIKPATEGADSTRLVILVELFDDGSDRNIGIIAVENIDIDIVGLQPSE